MNAFSTRATALVPFIVADCTDPDVLAELAELRSLWRELSAEERLESVAAAKALADAQVQPHVTPPAQPQRPPQSTLATTARPTTKATPATATSTATDEEDARRALSGLDRIDIEDVAERIYDGPADDPDALLAFFGLDSFRPGQRDAVVAAQRGRDCLVVMPTGGGKSLCYQLPGIASADLTIVVSPLIALMTDQYRRLRQGGHPVAMIASGMEPDAAARALADVRSGHARIVLCSPERFGSPGFLDAVASRRVDLFAVDEAHCVSEWGHDFRPDYLRLRGVIDRLGSPTVMACTATATEQVGREISARLGLRDPHTLRAGFDRPNLSFDVISLEGTGSKARKQMLLSLALADTSARPAIVYCGTRREVEEVSEQLRGEGLTAVGYHAGMPADERASAQLRFMTGDAEVVVATNAFGMGVDKADVRSVVHWAIPKSVEAYYQEVGRAGRDGLPARGILLAGRADLARLVNFIQRDAIATDDVMAFVGKLHARAAGWGGATGDEFGGFDGGELAGGDFDGDSAEPTVVIDTPREDRDRVCLGVAERAGLCRLEPAGGGQLLVTLTGVDGVDGVAAICRETRNRVWDAYHAVEAFATGSEKCRRRSLLDHFGDSSPTAPDGRCCDVCDPDTIGLPDPESLVLTKPKRKRSAGSSSGTSTSSSSEAVELDPAAQLLFDGLREWRARVSDGKPAYTVAHNSTLETIAVLRPASTEELATIKGVGPSFLERYGDEVLALVAGADSAPAPA